MLIHPKNNSLQQTIDSLEEHISFYRFDSARRSFLQDKMDLYRDSIKRVKQKRLELNTLKSASLNENLKDYDWKSLIRFIFIVASNPKDGTLYLMGLIMFTLTFAFMVRWLSLHYLARAMRIYKEISHNNEPYNDLAIPAPFWLAPFPIDNKKKVTSKNRVHQEELLKVLGFFPSKRKPAFFVACFMLVLILLQIRFFYICIYSNTPGRFDFIFTLSAILFLLSLFQTLIWFVPIKVEDHYNAESPRNNISRKVFIGITASALISAFLLSNKNRISNFYGLNAKRFLKQKNKKKCKNGGDIAEGLYYRNPHPKNKDKVKYLYFFDPNHYSITFIDIQNEDHLTSFKKHLLPVKETDNLFDGSFAFKYRSHSWHIEQYTFFLLKAGKKKQAVDFLVKSVTSQKFIRLNDYRLLDLAAILCLRYDGNELNTLVEFCDLQFAEDNSDESIYFTGVRYENKELMLRISKWRSKEWTNKIRKQKSIKWDNHKIV
ncbi:hypothetical protein [Niastella sp. OAS944]|uniref:hypothetical protein n=1 Tax=Niastella sp. OAS944 TaxID=2664089 RepID=UPI00346E18C3|nr:hypothetical protein [Chitinophagaceae bacterium OAS944]